MKEAIVIYGNIASGKSTFAAALAKSNPAYHYLCMDALREKTYFDSKQNAFCIDRECEKKLIEQISSHDKIIYETTAATKIFRRALSMLNARKFSIQMVYIQCHPDVCFQRFQARKQGRKMQVPPAISGMTVRECITHFSAIHTTIRKDIIINSIQLKPAEMLDYYESYCSH